MYVTEALQPPQIVQLTFPPLAPSHFTRFFFLAFALRRRILAVILGAYGIFDSFYDIRFIRTLRDREIEVAAQAEVATTNEDDSWGYGQILAVLIWAPIFVEYIYIIFGGPEKEEDKPPSTVGILEDTRYDSVPLHERSASVGET
jgi:hypothetical protein